MMKRSQVSVFIMLGIFILILAALFVTMQRIQKDIGPVVKEKYMLKGSVKPAKVYIESCLEQVSEPVIKRMGLQGGSLEMNSYAHHDGKKYRFLCRQGDRGCINQVLKRKNMEEQISETVQSNLKQCINLNLFKKQGYSIEEGNLNVDTRITLDFVKIRADYPLTFRKNTTTLRIKSFTRRIDKPLGRLYLMANNIVNIEITQGNFNQVKFMRNDNVNIIIQKHKPYPDTIYSMVSKNFTFNFAIEGKDTVSEIDYHDFTTAEQSHGCCYIKYDNNCYKNVPRILCEQKGGIYDPNTACQCPTIEPSGVNKCHDEECRDCQKTYEYTTDSFTGPSREHGESWCSYDSISGKGRDYVGSRHYLHYCIDGHEYVQECRDYREELCTQKNVTFNGTEITQAKCRPNRWQDCMLCQTQECCENEKYRDCEWKENSLDKKCVPEVPPGFRFWEENGRDICALASTEKTCDDFSCGEEWVTDSAELCTNFGDCGNYRNIADNITKEGFYHTDFKSEPENNIFNEDGLNKEGHRPWLNLGYSTERSPLMGSRQQESDNLVKIMSAFYSFLDELSGMSLSEVQDGNTDVSVKNVAICNLWKAPTGQNECSLCQEYEMIPCTEYRCKSLGQQCIYEEEQGIGRCHKPQDIDTNKPDIDINTSRLPEQYSLEQKELQLGEKEISGYELRQKIMPHEKLSLGITTDKDTVCRMTYMPKIGEINPRGYYVGSEGFETNHHLNLNIPPRPEFPEKLLDFMNASNSTEFIQAFKKTRQKIMQMQQDNKIRRIFSEILGDSVYTQEDVPEIIKLITSDLTSYQQAAQTILNKFEQGGYFMFFYCQDKAGNENARPVFLELSIRNSSEDNQPPRILGAVPENNGRFPNEKEEINIKFYLNEPAECRFSYTDKEFEDMNNSMQCTISRFEMEEKFGGSYLCQEDVPANDSIRLYVRCQDNPQNIMEKNFEIITHPIVRNTTGLKANDEIIQNDTLTTNANTTRLLYYLDDPKSCSLTYSPGKKSEGRCQTSNELDLGQYMCSFNISLNRTNSTNQQNISCNILCKEGGAEKNTNEESTVYNLHRSEELEIIDYGPKGDINTLNPLLYVETSESKNIRCGYYEDLELGTMRMDNMAAQKFSTILNNVSVGQNRYFVLCQDKYGNQAKKEITFYVLEE